MAQPVAVIAEQLRTAAAEVFEERVLKKFAHLSATAQRADDGRDREPEATDRAGDDSRRELLRVALIPERFRAATLANYEPATTSQGQALKLVRRWLELACGGGAPAMLALVGETGTGKSHLLYGALGALIDRWGKRPAWPYARPWYRLADELRYGGEHPLTGAPIEAQEVRRTLMRARAALIDEVRVTASTSFDDTELAKWACWAYDNMTAVIVTTNHSPLADIFGPAGASRFTQVVIEGPDRRHA